MLLRQHHGLVRVDIAGNLKRAVQSEEKCKQGMFEQNTDCTDTRKCDSAGLMSSVISRRSTTSDWEVQKQQPAVHS